jgi:hypothetical protein
MSYLLISLLIVMQAGYYPFTRQPKPDELRPFDKRDNGFTFCRLVYPSNRLEEDGTGWNTDYPLADRNFTTRLTELTTVRASRIFQKRDDIEFDHWVVPVGDKDIFLCPFLVTSDVGTMWLSEQEATNLRNYLLKGGFLWVDDFWGTESWDQWLGEMYKVFPDRPILTPTFDHPLYNTHYRIRETLQVSNINRWLGGTVQERGDDSPKTPLKIIVDDDNRIMVVMTHNSDIQDTWEQEAANPEYMATFSPDGYALGINILLYAITH